MKVNNTGRAVRNNAQFRTDKSSLEKKAKEGMGVRRKYSGDEKWLYREEKEEPIVEQQKVEERPKGPTGGESIIVDKTEDANLTPKQKKKKAKADKKKAKADKKRAKKFNPDGTKKKMKKWKKITLIIVGVIFLLMIIGACVKVFLFPDPMETVEEKTGRYALNNWESSVQTLNVNGLNSALGGKESYLGKEIEYAGKDKSQIKFIKKIGSTVNYTSEQVPKLSKYGKPLKSDGKIIMWDSLLTTENEPVELQYVDYSKVKFSNSEVKKALEKAEVDVNSENYTDKVVGVFCDLISKQKDLPLKTVKKYIPKFNIDAKGYYTMSEKEDINIDQYLFCSKDFDKLLDKFSEQALEQFKKTEKNPDGVDIANSEDWTAWEGMEKEAKKEIKEPRKYDNKYYMSNEWCGVYRLQTGIDKTTASGDKIKVKISARVGKGSKKDPAGLSTTVLTKTKDGKKIKVRLIDFGVSQDAIDWLGEKDYRNKGMEIKSPLQYCYAVYEVTNVSGEKLIIEDNSSLADKNGNVAISSGEIFGLQDSVELEPDKTGIIESWGCSTELQDRYLIWGKDVKDRNSKIFFRVLKGNIDDKSKSKGVYTYGSKQK